MKKGPVGVAAFTALVSDAKWPKLWELMRPYKGLHLVSIAAMAELPRCYWELMVCRRSCRACDTAPFSGQIEPCVRMPKAFPMAKSQEERTSTESGAA